MPASVGIVRWCGGTNGTPSPLGVLSGDITSGNTRANAFDVNTSTDSANPVQIPSSGINYSYWVTTSLYIYSWASSNTIQNIRWYSGGANILAQTGSGLDCYGGGAGTYIPAPTGTVGSGGAGNVGIVGQTGVVLNTTNHVGLYNSPCEVFTGGLVTINGIASNTGWNTSAPYSFPSISITNLQTGGPPSIPGLGYFVYQIQVTNSAQAGTSNKVTFTWKYDET